MRPFAFFGAAAALSLLLLPSAPVALAADKAEVEKIVHDYLLAHPEILNEMIAELNKREDADKQAKAQDGIAANKDAIYNDGYSYAAGNPNGDVTVVEFFDYRCGYCKKVRPELLELLEKDPGVRLVLKEFPILSKVSDEAAKAAIASLNQGGDLYWKFNNAMLSADDLDSDGIYSLAAASGLDLARLKKDMEDPGVAKKIADNHALAGKLGIDGTPAFVIGDKLVPGAVSVDELKEMVDAERNGG